MAARDRGTTHRLADDGALALCGEDATFVSPADASVSCPTCRAVMALRRRRPAAPGDAPALPRSG